MALLTQAGPVVLDLRDGSRRTPEEGEVFACLTEVTFRYEEGYAFPDRTEHERQGTGVITACDVRADEVDAPLGHQAVRGVAQRSGDVLLISVEGAVVAYAAGSSS